MTKRSRAALALLVSPWLYLAGHAAAQSLQPGENLLAPIPDDFKPGDAVDDSGMNMLTFLPRKETTANWTQMITTQVYHGMPKYDPDKFAQILGSKWKGACKGGEVKKLSGGLDNGYPVAIWQFYCPLYSNTRKPESMWMKLISGSDSLYNAHFTSRTKINPAMTTHALSYLQNVWVCDTRNNGHPCEQPAKPAAPTAAPAPAAPAAPASVTPAPATPSTAAPPAAATTPKPAAPAQSTTVQPTTPAPVAPPAKAPTAPAPSPTTSPAAKPAGH